MWKNYNHPSLINLIFVYRTAQVVYFQNYISDYRIETYAVTNFLVITVNNNIILRGDTETIIKIDSRQGIFGQMCYIFFGSEKMKALDIFCLFLISCFLKNTTSKFITVTITVLQCNWCVRKLPKRCHSPFSIYVLVSPSPLSLLRSKFIWNYSISNHRRFCLTFALVGSQPLGPGLMMS